MNDGSDLPLPPPPPAQPLPDHRTETAHSPDQGSQPLPQVSLPERREVTVESLHPLAEPLMQVAKNSNKWSRANTIATLEMAVFALFVSVLARGTALTTEQIQGVVSDAFDVVGTAVAPAAAVKGIVEFLRSDR